MKSAGSGHHKKVDEDRNIILRLYYAIYVVFGYCFNSFSNAPGSLKSIYDDDMLYIGPAIVRNKRCVPPYESSQQIIWSPCLHKCTTVVNAAIPEPYAAQYLAPFSSCAMQISNALRVGFVPRA